MTEIINNLFFLLLGIGIVYSGAEIIIWTSKRIALKLGISLIIISLTMVAAGTSLPETFVSWIASFKGASNLAFGNVVGSCIINIGLVLGIGAIIFPLKVEKEILKFDYPALFITSIILFITSLNHIISKKEGILYIILFLLYLLSLTKRKRVEKVKKENLPSLLKLIILSIIGFTFLYLGAKITVNKAIILARILGISELIIGITIVAFGTSIPELAVVVLGGIRKVPELSIGTIIGSNIANILLILGGSSIINPVVIKNSILLNTGSVLFFTIILLPFFLSKRKLSRYEGGLLFIFYIIYSYLLLK